MTLPIIILVFVALFVLYLWGTYNQLIVLKNRIEEAWSGIDVQLKRRTDLIPNLLETVKGYAKHEKSVFEQVTKARSAMMSAKSVKDVEKADNALSGTLKSLFAVAEAYPDLKANTNFQDLQRELGDTEDKIAYSRQFYNSNILNFNNLVQMFPSNIIANVLHFQQKEFFGVKDADREPVKVNFN